MKGAHHPLQQLNSPADNINRHQKEGRIKQPDFDTSASVMKDALLKVNGDARESSEPSFCTKDNLLNCIAYVNQVIHLRNMKDDEFETIEISMTRLVNMLYKIEEYCDTRS